MNPKLIISRLGKYRSALSTLNKDQEWGMVKSILTYFDYTWAFLLHGCLIDQYVTGKFYSYKHFYRKQVITQRRLEWIINKVNSKDHIHLLENKTHFNRHFKQWVNRGWLHSSEMDLPDFEQLCKLSTALFVKPLDSYEGKGVRRIESPRRPSGIESCFNQLKSQNVIIEQELPQHPAMVFGNKSVNTIRINTMLDKNGNVHIFKPVLRAGVGQAFVDNYNAGGVEYAIDTQTGIISMPGYYHGKMTEIYHPGTDIKMPGYQIPEWDKVIDVVKAAARHIPQCRFIGWDVAITPQGIEFIEGNHNPGYVCMEYFGQTGWFNKLKKYL